MLQPTLKQMREDIALEHTPLKDLSDLEHFFNRNSSLFEQQVSRRANLADRLKTLKIGAVTFLVAAFIDYSLNSNPIDNLTLNVCFSSGIVAGRALRNIDRNLFYSTLPAIAGSVLYSFYKEPLSAVVNIGAYVATTFGTWLFSPSNLERQAQQYSEY